MRAKTRNVFFALLGVAGLVIGGHYSGPYREAVHSYGGNIAASFAVYYVVALLPLPPRFGKLLTAGLALAVVELFEVSNGFGVMTNVYDQVDFGECRRSCARLGRGHRDERNQPPSLASR